MYYYYVKISSTVIFGNEYIGGSQYNKHTLRVTVSAGTYTYIVYMYNIYMCIKINIVFKVNI